MQPRDESGLDRQPKPARRMGAPTRSASVSYGQKGHCAMRGWCVWDAQRPELGSKGPFADRASAEQWARENGFDGIDSQSAGRHLAIPDGDWGAVACLVPYRVLYRSGGANFTGATAPLAVRWENYEEVGTVEAPDVEALFRDMNAVEGTETCCKLRVRSMSVGDIALDTREGVAWYCAPTGWKPVALIGFRAAGEKP